MSTPLRLVIFDFDCTLSAQHVFSLLCNGEGLVPPPHASTERGQLAKIRELDELPKFQSSGGFAQTAFGGEKRVQELQAFFAELDAAGVECMVCSRGLVGPIKKCLEQVGLLHYFSRVYANIGTSYGERTYDKALPPLGSSPDEQYLGEQGDAGWGSKGRLVWDVMTEKDLEEDEALFVDDTASEIASVRGSCRVLHVQPARGIGAEHFAFMRGLLAPPPSEDVDMPPAPTEEVEPALPDLPELPAAAELVLDADPVLDAEPAALDLPLLPPAADAAPTQPPSQDLSRAKPSAPQAAYAQSPVYKQLWLAMLVAVAACVIYWLGFAAAA